MASNTDDAILSGFLCPICKLKLENEECLQAHYVTHEEAAAEKFTDEEDVTYRKKVKDGEEDDEFEKTGIRSSMSKILGKARRSIEIVFESLSNINRASNSARSSTVSEADLRSKDLLELFNGKKDEEKVKLSIRCHTDGFLDTRAAIIRVQGKKNDRILSNINKHLYTKSQKTLLKRITLQDSLESEAKYCSKCKNSFDKISPRKHHCKLCAVAICDDCSLYLKTNEAELIISRYEATDTSEQKIVNSKSLRHCEECDLHLKVMEARSKEEDEITRKMMEIYKELHNLKRQISQTVGTYEEIRVSLLQGKTIHSLSQGVAVKEYIAQRRREIALLGERIAEIPARDESTTARLLESIKRSTEDFVGELMSLPQLPTQEEAYTARTRRFSHDHIPSVIVSEH